MDFAYIIICYMRSLGLAIAPRNQIFIEDCDENGNPLSNEFRADQWNDRALIFDYNADADTAKIIHNAAATCEPGVFYTVNRMNPDGAFRIKHGQYKAWQIGNHKGQYPALTQCRSISGYRDDNEDGIRTGDCEVSGTYGVDIHYGYDSTQIGRGSAGCLVRQYKAAHYKAMELIQVDPPADGIYTVTILPGDKVFEFGKTLKPKNKVAKA